jgi:hypothetical protein
MLQSEAHAGVLAEPREGLEHALKIVRRSFFRPVRPLEIG